LAHKAQGSGQYGKCLYANLFIAHRLHVVWGLL
jgi:hypothetical protein